MSVPGVCDKHFWAKTAVCCLVHLSDSPSSWLVTAKQQVVKFQRAMTDRPRPSSNIVKLCTWLTTYFALLKLWYLLFLRFLLVTTMVTALSPIGFFLHFMRDSCEFTLSFGITKSAWGSRCTGASLLAKMKVRFTYTFIFHEDMKQASHNQRLTDSN